MPNHYTHTIFKQYMETILNEDKKKAAENEQLQDTLEDAMT